jgi:thiamine biosynthesis lipoprotein
MSRKFIIPTIVIVAVAIFALLYKGPKMAYKKIHGETQGTTYNITYEYKKNKDIQPAIDALLHKFDMSLSTYEANSIISRVNKNDPTVKVDDLFTRVFNKSKEVFVQSGGAFDLTVAPLVNAWGFGFAKGANVDSASIDSLLQYVGMDKVRIEGRKVIKQSPNIMLDVNAIAQGFSVDVVSEFLDKKHIANYLVEIGGELKCKGKNDRGEDWVIGIDRPVDGNFTPGKDIQAIVAIKTKSLATSGNYRQFYEKGGVKYAHTIDPKTGYPVLSNLLSATVLADDCMTADAYATVLMVIGLDKSIQFLKLHPELEAYLVYSDEEGKYRIYDTPGMKEHVLTERSDE